ncbi:MAG: hypothetical protein WDN24_22185 [Sphingomonas sp.]
MPKRLAPAALALALALLLPAAAQAQSYRSISIGPSSMTFLEEGTLQRYAGMASATFLFVFRTSTKEGIRAQTANFHISCETPGNTFSYGNFVNFGPNMEELSKDSAWKSGTNEAAA